MPTKLIVVVLIMGLGRTQLLSQQTGRVDVPAKIELSPVRSENKLGEAVPVRIQLLDQSGRPVAANRKIEAEVNVRQPSGQTSNYTVTFTPGESSKELPLSIAESGVAKLTIQQRDQQLIGGSSFVLVRPESKKAAKPAAQRAADQSRGPASRLLDAPRWRGDHARLIQTSLIQTSLIQTSLIQTSLVQRRVILAAFPLQVPASGHAQPAAAPQLQLTISGEDANGGTRADGSTCAQIQIFYLGADDLLRDVQIWLSPSNGKLDNNPIVIRKGTASGSACWTSQYPIAAATLTVAATNPPGFTFASTGSAGDPKIVTHKFTDNIRGIEFVNVPKSITIVDSFNLTARFADPNDNPVPLTDQREVHFSTDSAILKINPLQTVVASGGFDSSTILVPTYFGTSTVQVFTPDYAPVSSTITITWVSVLIASLLGGLIGGLLAWVNSQGKLWVRIVTGLIVGLVASWAYVVVGLPKLETQFLHNQLSVFFVALIVGFSGVKGLTALTSKFNLAGF